jgi:hypothetical protein
MSEPAFELLQFAGIAAACYGLYLFLLRRMAAAVQPYRLRLAELGERLLARGVDPVAEATIRFDLQSAFSPWPMVLLAALMPVFVLKEGFWAALGRPRRRPEPTLEMQRLIGLVSLSWFAANPLFGLIVALELLVLSLLALLVAGNLAVLRHAVRLLAAFHPSLGLRDGLMSSP